MRNFSPQENPGLPSGRDRSWNRYDAIKSENGGVNEADEFENGAINGAASVPGDQSWVLAQYATDLTRNLKLNELRPTSHFYRHVDYKPPPNPTVTADPSSKGPAPGGGSGGGMIGKIFSSLASRQKPEPYRPLELACAGPLKKLEYEA